MKEKFNFKILSVLIITGITLTFLALAFLPLGLTALLKISNIDLGSLHSAMAIKISLCIYACAVPYIIALFKLLSVCKLLVSKNSFDIKISKAFNSISICAFGEAVIFTLATFIVVNILELYLYAFTFLSLIIILFVSVTLGFLFKCVSVVFKKAAEIKEEYDLTF